jgi:hypothetical protein
LAHELGPEIWRLAADEVGEGNAQGRRDPSQAEDGGVPFAAFDQADEDAVQPAEVVQLGLRQAVGIGASGQA